MLFISWLFKAVAVSVFVVAASGGGDLLVDILADLQGNILTRLYRNIQHDLRQKQKII